MRLAITIGFKHGCGTPVVVIGPEVPLAEQRAAMRATRQQPHHEQFQRIELWTSNQGRIARKRLGHPVEEIAPGNEQEATGDESAAAGEGTDSSESSSAKAAAKKKPAKSK